MRKVSESRIITYKVDNNISSSCRLDVRERPVAIERRLSDMAAREGDDVVFECFFSKPDLPVSEEKKEGGGFKHFMYKAPS